MVFIAAGMGGGTGTGAAPVIARVAKELGILTVAVVTKPFLFEGKRRMRTAEAGIAELARHVDTLIVIPNQNLFKIADERTPFAEAFVLADQVLYSGIACIVDLVVRDALINLDLADVRTVLSGMGTAMMGTGEASGDDRAIAAARDAIYNPLLDDVSLGGAKSLLLSIGGGHDLTLYEVHDAVDCVRQELDADANIIFGATLDEALTGRIRVSIVASGMHRTEPAPAEPALAAAPRQGLRQDLRRGGAPAREPAPAQRRAEPAGGRREPRFDPPAAVAGERELWRGPGDVVIRERPPQLPGHSSYGGRSAREGDAADRSEKQQSYGGRGRRQMPTLEDFPPVAQREYRAKVGDGRREQPQDAPPPSKKPSLLQRLRGGGRERRADAQPVAGRTVEEPLDLPVFFRRDPRS
jgi:cell division protein FtsZ